MLAIYILDHPSILQPGCLSNSHCYFVLVLEKKCDQLFAHRGGDGHQNFTSSVSVGLCWI